MSEQNEQLLTDDLVSVGKFKLKLVKWDMRKQLAYQNLFLPLISGPIVSGLAYKNDDEEKVLAAIISGLLDAIADSDMIRIAEICLDGVGFKTDTTPMKLASIEALDSAGAELSDIYTIVALVIKKNMGSLLKKDLLNSLMTTIGMSAGESLSY